MAPVAKDSKRWKNRTIHEEGDALGPPPRRTMLTKALDEDSIAAGSRNRRVLEGVGGWNLWPIQDQGARPGGLL